MKYAWLPMENSTLFAAPRSMTVGNRNWSPLVTTYANNAPLNKLTNTKAPPHVTTPCLFGWIYKTMYTGPVARTSGRDERQQVHNQAKSTSQVSAGSMAVVDDLEQHALICGLLGAPQPCTCLSKASGLWGESATDRTSLY
jgi:hypothetical protein